MSGKSYEQEFDLEQERMKVGVRGGCGNTGVRSKTRVQERACR